MSFLFSMNGIYFLCVLFSCIFFLFVWWRARLRFGWSNFAHIQQFRRKSLVATKFWWENVLIVVRKITCITSSFYLNNVVPARTRGLKCNIIACDGIARLQLGATQLQVKLWSCFGHCCFSSIDAIRYIQPQQHIPRLQSLSICVFILYCIIYAQKCIIQLKSFGEPLRT